MSAPDTIYMHPASQIDVYATTDGEGRIAYDRRKTCVWTQDDDRAWHPGCGNGEGEDNEAPSPHVWELVYCPYCAGEIQMGGS